MKERAERLQFEIAKLRKLAEACDPDIAQGMDALADEMERLVTELQEEAWVLLRERHQLYP